MVFAAIKGCQKLPGTRPGHAFPGLNQKQRGVGRALNQAGAGVEELIGVPLQRYTAMRAAVFVDIDLAVSANREHACRVLFETQAGAFGQRFRGA